MDLTTFEAVLSTLNSKRYENDFSEKKKIGRGGFASVYSARNNFDLQTYAIKKVKLAIKNVQKNFNLELQKLLAEAKVLASVDHPNILRYYNSWLEATTKKRKPDLTLSIPAKNRPKLQVHDDSPFILDGLDDSKDNSPTIVFNNDSKEGHDNLSPSKPPIKEDKLKGMFYMKMKDIYKTREPSFEDTPVQFQKHQQLPKKSPKLKKKATPKVGDEIVESITLYLQTELCSETLEDYVAKRNNRLHKLKRDNSEAYQVHKRLFIKEAFSFAKQILSAVAHIHSKGIVHRDLKPGNIFLVDRTVKIGDFGLVKRLNSFSPLEASPILTEFNDDGSLSDSFKLDSAQNNFSSEEELALKLGKTQSEPIMGDQPELYMEIGTSITKSVGTKTYASPEQLRADKDNFDHRADIFSLGVVLLLLFHPMTTAMEQQKTIKDYKKGYHHVDLVKEMPEISDLIIKMLAHNPNDRPSFDEIIRSLNHPFNRYSDLSGALTVRRENSGTWREKHFKLVDKTLYIFQTENDKKAEQIYDLSTWNVFFKNNEGSTERAVGEDQKQAFISLDDPMQLGCAIKADSFSQTFDLFHTFRRIGESC